MKSPFNSLHLRLIESHHLMILGLNHLTLAIRELEPALSFYQDVVGCRLLARWPGGAYFLAGSLWLALIVDAQRHQAPLPEYTHFALDVAPDDFADMAERILSSGARIWKDNLSEGDSLYFLDPEGHKLELHAGNLKSRLLSASAAPWPGLEILLTAEQMEVLL